MSIQKSKNIFLKFLILLIIPMNIILCDPPNWDENGDGVLDNYNDYEFNGSITAMISSDEGSTSYASEGDMIAVFVLGEQRGVGLTSLVPFGPYQGTYQFQMMMYSNQSSGETLAFQYYDQSTSIIYDLSQTLEFTTNMIEGSATEPFIFIFDPNTSDDVYGCTDMTACNYNTEATSNDGSCEYPSENYNCEGDCIVNMDCSGICGGPGIVIEDECCISGITDICGVCDGDNSTCLGCTDEDACNYDSSALANDDSCVYPETDYDCDGDCLLILDCLGECGGVAEYDQCDICDSDLENDCMQDCNGDWGGIAYLDNCNECVGGNTNDEACLGNNYILPLHVGSNLVSFYSMPIDNSLDYFLSSNTNDYIYAVYGLTNSAINLGDNLWQGSLDMFIDTEGYWFKSINTTEIQIENVWEVPNDLIYNLSSGANLVSFPEDITLPLENAISDIYISNFDAIIGESLIAIQSDGNWVGSLEELSGGNAYYFILNSALEFTYTIDSLSLQNQINIPNEVNKLHVQSSLQSFYFIDNIELLNIEQGDWILAYNNGTLVGSRRWSDNIKDIAVMGNDGSDYSIGFCNNDDTPKFKILKKTGEYIDLYGDIPSWDNLEINFINLFTDNSGIIPLDFKISNIYPNPFNPITNFNLELHTREFIKISIYDLNGKLIDSLFNGYLDKGMHSYSWDASSFTSGIYFISANTPERSISQKITLIK